MRTWLPSQRKPNPDPDGVFSAMPLESFVGHHVQLCFTYGCGKHYEYMWVKVTEVGKEEGAELIGFLDNDPVHVTDYKYQDGVGFDRKEIEKLL